MLDVGEEFAEKAATAIIFRLLQTLISSVV